MNNNNKNKVSEEKLFFSNWTFSFLNLKFLDIKEERSIECKLFDALIFKKKKKKTDWGLSSYRYFLPISLQYRMD